jgi:signal peptidase I
VKRHRIRSAILTSALLALGLTGWHFFASPLIGGSTSYVVTHGISMEPRFKTGDLALVKPASQYKVGDVVAYHSSLLHIVVLHRIYAIHNGRYTFKGDNNDFLDPVQPTRADLIGKLWLHFSHGGIFLTALHTPITAAVLIGVIGLALLGTPKAKRGRRDRRKRRASGPRPHGAPAVMAENPGAAQPISRNVCIGAAGVIGAVAVVFLGISLLAFARPVKRTTTHKIPYTQTVRLGYHAKVRSGPVYPSGTVATGDPIFLTLVHKLGVGFDYRLAGAGASALRGTDRVVLKVTGPTGWSRTIPLTPTRHFTGDHVTAHVSLNLSSLQAMVTQISTQTGLSPTGYMIAVTPQVHIHGLLAGLPLVASFSPALSFSLQPLQLQPGGGSSGSTQSGFAPIQRGNLMTSGVTGNDLTVLGLSAPISTLRLLGPIGLLVALAGAVALTILVVRSPAFSESARIQSKYGHMMVPINAGTDLGWPAIDVGSMKALSRLAAASGQLILHSHGDAVDTYLVNDDGSVYRYQVELPKIVWGEWSETVTQLAALPETPSPRSQTGSGSRNGSAGGGGSDERGDSGEVAAEDERLDGVGPLVGGDDLHVGEMAGHVMAEQQPVAAEDVPGLRADELGLADVVQLGQ